MTPYQSPDPDTFLRAARLLEYEWSQPRFGQTWYPPLGCCNAIRRAGTSLSWTSSELRFFGLFDPSQDDLTRLNRRHRGDSRLGYWWGPDELEPRLIALCLAAAILEDEQTPEQTPKQKRPFRRRKRVSTIQ